MKNYLDALENIMKNGIDREGRNGFTRSLFALQLRWDMRDGFPAITTKELKFNSVKGELLWFLSGSESDEDLKDLMDKNKTIWTDNAEADYWKDKARYPGDLGRIYGAQWRNFIGTTIENRSGYLVKGFMDSREVIKVDQITELIKKLKDNPFDRRLVVSAWNAAEVHYQVMALPPCHMLFQCYVDNQKRLSLHMIQRSCDMFLGVPFNIASYALLLHMLAQVTYLIPHELIITFNDAHIYHEHFDAVKTQLSRKCNLLPDLLLNPRVENIEDFEMSDIQLANYDYHPPIKAKMVV